MSPGVWVLLGAVVAAAAVGTAWTLRNGVFRGTRRVRAGSSGPGILRGVTNDRQPSVLAGTTYDARRGDRATLLQFSSAFCAPCRATRRTLTEVARVVPGVSHVEVDAEHHLDLVRELGVVRTPTTLVLDAQGRELTRASGAPRPHQVLTALAGSVR